MANRKQKKEAFRVLRPTSQGRKCDHRPFPVKTYSPEEIEEYKIKTNFDSVDPGPEQTLNSLFYKNVASRWASQSPGGSDKGSQ